MDREDTKQQALFAEYPDIINVEQLSTMLGIKLIMADGSCLPKRRRFLQPMRL